jgi:hypothetical protein
MKRMLAVCLVLLACSKAKPTDEAKDEDDDKDDDKSETTTLVTPAGTVKTTTSGETGSIVTPEGTVTYGTNKAPADFPLPILPGATVEATISGAQTGQAKHWQVTLLTKQSVTEAGAFYEKTLTDKGFQVNKMQQNSGGEEMMVLGGEKKDADVAVVLGKSPEGTSISLTWSSKTP